ncbi:MAG: gluconate 2-dehydrogenase subunit 3 family protein [Mucilaginibacter sp.]|uniref:gluconate 2-dehydrogenase subunit 3 family protein n=1 Tax=Mucilaginibacter sp. TaxID=1882438 RepID=UPI0034E5E2A5
MDRKKAIKSLAALGFLGLTSASVFEWTKVKIIISTDNLNQKKYIIAELAEMIIPRTNTPGAKDAEVETYIINNIKFCTDQKSQQNFLHGLLDLENYAFEKYNASFINCSSDRKAKILTFFEQNAFYKYQILNKIQNKVFGKPFFSLLKELTIEGYCTSQKGATIGLVYDYIPSSYHSCILLSKNQRSWATK